MIVLDCEQGSSAWHEARLGRPTASNLAKILTPLGKLSESARKFAVRLATERLLGEPLDDVVATVWMEHGRISEDDAAKAYSFANGVELKKVGFVLTDDKRVGASPDRLIVGANGAVEIKAPSPVVQATYLAFGTGLDHTSQVHGQLFVCELDFVDLYSWHARMPSFTQRIHRDETIMRRMGDALNRFCDQVDEIEMRLRNAGTFQASSKIVPPLEAEFLERSAPALDE